jgi:hypothetical protein
LIKEKARQFATALAIDNPPIFSNGWLASFNKRHSFREHRIHGESGDAQMTDIEDTLAVIKEKIARYEPKEVYNMDETGLFYNLAPSTTISRRQIEGSKKDKTRLTIGLTCNADGSDRLPPLFIGHAAKPRCFKGKTGQELGFYYLNNTKAWMTGVFFLTFIKQFNNHVNKRRVLLLLDNAPSHIWTDSNKADYPNLEIVFLPPNTTSKLQPMDAGIIAAFKRQYCKYQLQHAIDLIDRGKAPYKIDQLKAMQWTCMIWRNMDSSTLANCWRHTTLLTNEMNVESESDIPEDNVDTEFAVLLQYLDIEDGLTFDQYINIPEEEQTDQILTDEELIEIAKTVEQDKEQEEAAEEPDLGGVFSKQESITGLGKAIVILESSDAMQGGWDMETERLITGLRKKQSELRREMLLERDQSMTQMSIRGFLIDS